MKPKLLTDKEKEFIKENRLLMSSRQIAKHLDRSKTAVQRFLKKNGIKPPPDVINGFRKASMTGRTTFSSEEDDKIMAEYLHKPVKALAEEMGRSYTGIMGRIKALGLTIPEHLIEQRKKESQFNKGHLTWNKGTKGLTGANCGSFKKGHLPHNTRNDGAVSIRMDKTGRSYKYKRVAKGKWELLQRLVWEHHHGQIPEGHNVYFKDGNTMNCSINNLILLSNVELMDKNSIHRFPQPVKDAIYALKQLKRTINKQS